MCVILTLFAGGKKALFIITRLYEAPAIWLQGEAGREALRVAVGDGEYFLAILPDGSRLVHAITRGERHPLSFGREVRCLMGLQ